MKIGQNFHSAAQGRPLRRTAGAAVIAALAVSSFFMAVPETSAKTGWHAPVVRRDLTPEEREFALKHGIPLYDRARVRREMKRENEAKTRAEEDRSALETKRVDPDSSGGSGGSRGSVRAAWSFVKIAANAKSGAPRALIAFRYAEPGPEVPANVVFDFYQDDKPHGLRSRIAPETGADAARFVAALRAVSAKMSEWQAVAQSNGVTDLVKEFPAIDWPAVVRSDATGFKRRNQPVAEYVIRKKGDDVEYICRLSLKDDGGSASSASVFVEMDKAGMAGLLSILPQVAPALEAEKLRRDEAAAAEERKAELFK